MLKELNEHSDALKNLLADKEGRGMATWMIMVSYRIEKMAKIVGLIDKDSDKTKRRT